MSPGLSWNSRRYCKGISIWNQCCEVSSTKNYPKLLNCLPKFKLLDWLKWCFLQIIFSCQNLRNGRPIIVMLIIITIAIITMLRRSTCSDSSIFSWYRSASSSHSSVRSPGTKITRTYVVINIIVINIIVINILVINICVINIIEQRLHEAALSSNSSSLSFPPSSPLSQSPYHFSTILLQIMLQIVFLNAPSTPTEPRWIWLKQGGRRWQPFGERKNG